MEEFDLYDFKRQPLNKNLIRGEKIPKNCFRLVVHICIFNSKGQMLIQQRDKSKKTHPNTWDITLGGCVQAGENTRQAAQRELSEELGLKHDFSNTLPHLTINFDSGFDDFYLINKDISLKDVKFIDGEVQAIKWASLRTIKQMIKNGQFINYHPDLIATLFSMHTCPPGIFKTKQPKI